jgi:hypothetical protein
MLRKTITVLLLTFGCFSLAFAAKSDAGTAGAAFLKLSGDRRATAMGDASAATCCDATSVFGNPAGLNLIEKHSVSLMHASWFEDITGEWFSYGYKNDKFGCLGLGVQYLSYGSIIQTDSTGLDTGTFSPNDKSITLTYAREFGKILSGISAKYISSTITQSATAYGADIGAMYKANDKLNIGACVQNIGTKLKFISEEDALPMNVKVGAGYKFKDNLLFALDINNPSDNEINYGGGVEFKKDINDKLKFALRGGYTTKTKDTGGTNGITAGLGLGYGDYRLDYVYVPFGDLGNTQRIAFSVNLK